MNRIGSLRQQVTLLSPMETTDDIGGLVRSFSAVAVVNASLEALRGIEEPVDERKGQRLTFRLTLRWRGDLEAGWRIMLGPRGFDVLSAMDPDGRGHFLVCEIEELRA